MTRFLSHNHHLICIAFTGVRRFFSPFPLPLSWRRRLTRWSGVACTDRGPPFCVWLSMVWGWLTTRKQPYLPFYPVDCFVIVVFLFVDLVYSFAYFFLASPNTLLLCFLCLSNGFAHRSVESNDLSAVEFNGVPSTDVASDDDPFSFVFPCLLPAYLWTWWVSFAVGVFCPTRLVPLFI